MSIEYFSLFFLNRNIVILDIEFTQPHAKNDFFFIEDTVLH
jgi:hypothetical protein